MTLARYGDIGPQLLYLVEYGQDRWKDALQKWNQHGRKGSLALPMNINEILLRYGHDFFIPFVELNDKYFDAIAAAIRFYKKRENLLPEDSLRLKLSNPISYWPDDGKLLTPKQIAARVSYTGDMDYFRRLLKRMKICHHADRKGRPRKSRLISAKGRLHNL
jgi:hypothetical protein